MKEFHSARFARLELAILVISVALAAGFAAYFWSETLFQPLITQHSFRQTQTAITTYYLFTDGTSLFDYQTPVVGYPWSIPFEFPLFQFFVFLFHKGGDVGLDIAGRLTSIAFGIASLIVAIALLRMLNLSKKTCLVFALLCLASPIYLYWNRAFMIESTALFFTLCALYCYVKGRRPVRASNPLLDPFLWGLLLFLSLALVTKVTTSFSIFILIGADQVFLFSKRFIGKDPEHAPPIYWQVSLGIILTICFTILFVWTKQADLLKAANPIGTQLTSTRLTGWNFGQLSNIVSYKLWGHVVYGRMLTPAGFGPALILLASALWVNRKQFRVVIVLATLLGLAVIPLLVFSNLHQVHRYYQSANQIFLLAAIATAYAMSKSDNPAFHVLRVSCLIAFIYGGYEQFYSEYYPKALEKSSREMPIAHTLKSITEPNEGIVIFGFNWSSTIAYYAERRALAVPKFIQARKVITQEQVFSGKYNYFGGMPLGAIVFTESLAPEVRQRACGSDEPIPEQKVAGAFVYDCSS